ncbi:siderophore-interacting protein [Glutamicibacter sp.]|uniref:siderophore-interacting protein n=1 Tax=Glutamicibacter sp. TaxID=1931995 RepID=UPI002B45FDD5|nr:siderophore-interacting protein [Glutamicibacter sp.]HJX77566.1 siderophore-interacting protein [Glutamicibacter sp.]
MSKHHKHSKYGPQLVVEASEHFTLQVLNHAEKSGAKVGAKIAKRALKNARGRGTDLNALQTDELLLAAQQAGASAALAAARRVLGKSLGSKEPTRQGIDADHTSFQSERETTSSANNGFGQHVLAVKRVEKLSPEMIRVIAGAKQLAGYRQNGKADQYVKVFFADPALGLKAPYDLKTLRRSLPREQVPCTRSYTIRWIDQEAEELAIDFVLHGDGGPGSAWASTAKPGDPLVISESRGKFSPNNNVDNYVFAADEAGIPAVSVAMGMLRSDAKGVALLEVDGPESEFAIDHPSGIELRWVHRNGLHPGTSDVLVDAFSRLATPRTSTSVMVHAERSTAKAVSHVAKSWELSKRDVHVSSYWTLRTKRPRTQRQ